MNINDFNRLYRRTKTGIGVTGSAVEIKLKPIPQGRVRVLSHVALENLSSPYTKARLAICHSGQNLYVDEISNIGAAVLAVCRSDIVLGEGDYFLAELTGTTTGDNLRLTCIGWDIDL